MDSKVYAERCLRDEAQALLDLIPQLDNNFEQVVDLIHQPAQALLLHLLVDSTHQPAALALHLLAAPIHHL